VAAAATVVMVMIVVVIVVVVMAIAVPIVPVVMVMVVAVGAVVAMVAIVALVVVMAVVTIVVVVVARMIVVIMAIVVAPLLGAILVVTAVVMARRGRSEVVSESRHRQQMDGQYAAHYATYHSDIALDRRTVAHHSSVHVSFSAFDTVSTRDGFIDGGDATQAALYSCCGKIQSEFSRMCRHVVPQ